MTRLLPKTKRADWSELAGVCLRGTALNVDCANLDNFKALPKHVVFHDVSYDGMYWDPENKLAWYQAAPGDTKKAFELATMAKPPWVRTALLPNWTGRADVVEQVPNVLTVPCRSRDVFEQEPPRVKFNYRTFKRVSYDEAKRAAYYANEDETDAANPARPPDWTSHTNVTLNEENNRLEAACGSYEKFLSLPVKVRYYDHHYRRGQFNGQTQLAYYYEADTTLPEAASDVSTASAAPPDEAGGQLTFDKAALLVMREAAVRVFAAHPEVRSVVVALDYAGELNEARVDKGLWIGREGLVDEIAAIFGSARATSTVLEQILVRTVQLEEHLRMELIKTGAEVIQARRKQDDDATSAAKPASADAGAGHERGDAPGGGDAGAAIAAAERRVADARGGGPAGDAPGPA